MSIDTNTQRYFIQAVIFITFLVTPTITNAEVWRQDSFEDFSRGHSDDGGVNLYAAADGTVRTIYTFDYNRDGANDILIVSGHDNAYAPPTYIYLNDEDAGFDRRYRWLLLGNGAAGGTFADLDGNGYQDAILCGTSNGANFAALDAVIYYGSDRGYSKRASINLPTYMSKAVAVVDCDGDGLNDLVFAQGHQPGLVIYLNSPEGFDNSRRRYIECEPVSHCLVIDFNGDGRDDLTVLAGDTLLIYLTSERGLGENADRVVSVQGKGGRYAIADLDRDGYVDVAVTNHRSADVPRTDLAINRSDSDAMIYWGDPQGQFAEREPTLLPGGSTRDLAVADFNRDGWPDIVLANFGNDNATGDIPSTIYWGAEDGFRDTHISQIDSRFARSVRVADFNGDGWVDLAIACYRNDTSHNVDSFICYNRQGEFLESERVGVTTLGAVNIATGDADHDGRTDVMFLNTVDGTNGLTDSVIYWNDGKGDFGPDRVSKLEARDPFTHVVTDFDLDGQLDIVLANSFEYARYREEGSYLYWGSPDHEADWSPRRRSVLATNFATGVVAGDFNRDGWLDLAFAQIGESLDERVSYSVEENRSPVFWGSPDGYQRDRVTWLPVENPRGLTTADLNKDGWLDLIYTNLTHETVPLFWGSRDGFSAAHRTDLAVPGKGTVCVNVADIDNDGWLDLLYSCFYDYSSKELRSDRLSYLFLGSPDGFDPSRRVGFQTMAPTQTAIADFNQDGLLDIFFPNYANTYINRTWSSYLYYNGVNGFRPGRRTSLYTESGSYGLALDFNRDGWLDLAVGSHMQGNGNHRSQSGLYYGGEDGFSDYRKLQYPTSGSHELTSVDPGHVYHRRFELCYYSDVYDAGRNTSVRGVFWDADTPHGSELRLEVRSADNRQALAAAGWQSVTQNERAGGVKPNTTELMSGRFIQYRAIFRSTDGSNYPILNSIEIELE